MIMKGLTLTQPWATAAALRSKRLETRSWSTRYRGAIAIHAAKGFTRHELLYLSCCWNWVGAMWATGVRMGDGPKLVDVLPFGAIIAVAEIVDCRPTGSLTQAELDEERFPDGEHGRLYKWTERQMGDFSLGRFAFTLDRVQPLAEPIPYKGALGLWTIPEELLDEIAIRLATKVAA